MAKQGNWGDKIIIVLHANDSKRDRRRCFFYRKKDGYCLMLSGRCVGSAHCKQYKAIQKPKPVQVITPKKSKRISDLNVPEFEGIQLISMKDIALPEKYSTAPSQEKVNAIMNFYHQYGTLDKPIIVRCVRNKYVLEDKYLRYYVAKKLELKEIHAKIGLKKNMNLEDAIRTPGTKLIHIKYGEVKVEFSDLRHVVVTNSQGDNITLDIETCLKNKLFSLIT